jgi:hypothetical protein
MLAYSWVCLIWNLEYVHWTYIRSRLSQVGLFNRTLYQTAYKYHNEAIWSLLLKFKKNTISQTIQTVHEYPNFKYWFTNGAWIPVISDTGLTSDILLFVKIPSQIVFLGISVWYCKRKSAGSSNYFSERLYVTMCLHLYYIAIGLGELEVLNASAIFKKTHLKNEQPVSLHIVCYIWL